MTLTKSIKEIIEVSNDPLLSIHPSWKRVQMKDIGNILNGFAFKSKLFNNEKKGIPLIRIRDISNNESNTYYSGNYDEIYIVSKEDILIGMDGDFNCSIWKGAPSLLNQRVCKVEIKTENYSKDFLFLVLPNYLKAINEHTSSQTVKHLSSSSITEILLPLPPLPEQHRIVAAIEELFARLDATNERLDRVPGIMKSFRQAVLAAACDGRLTEDWRVIHQNSQVESEIFEKKINANSIYFSEKPMTFDNEVFPTLPDNWCWATIEELASAEPRSIQSGPFGSSLLHSEFQETGILAVGIDNVLDRNFSLGKEHRISNEKYQELKKYTARPLDVLITVMATVGRCCVVPQDIETAIITKHVYRITPNREAISPYYLMNALSGASIVKEQIDNQIRGQTRPGINGKILKTTSIPLPPLSEQQEIVRRVDVLFAFADSIEAKVAVAREKTERLRQSILAKAFSGELVSTEAELARQEGREYESAEVLLKRIKAEGKSGKK